MEFSNLSESGLEPAHEALRALLPAYCMEDVLHQRAALQYPELATHLQICEQCTAELAELNEMLATVVQPRTVTHYPQADLTFLSSEREPARPWQIDALGRLIVTFSATLLETLRPPAYAGAMRGRLLYRYVQEATPPAALGLTIEISGEDRDPNLGLVRVQIDDPARDPFNQSGTLVAMQAGDHAWNGITDEAGCIDFDGVPLSSLTQLKIAVGAAD